jgi:hypothetical protein
MEEFDPAKHAVNADGTPKKRGDGSFALKRGRKPGQTAARSSLPPKPGETPPVNNDAEEAAKVAANLTINGATFIFGDEWRPVDKGEPEMLKTAYQDYFEARGVKKLPPEAGLFVALAAYALPRINKPTTRDRLGAIKVKFGGFFKRFKRRKHGDAVQPDEKREAE